MIGAPISQRNSIYWCFSFLCLFLFVYGCGGGQSQQQPAPPTTPPVSITVTVSPSLAAINTGQSTQFTAVVTGDNSGVTWAVNGVAGGNSTLGTIDPTGKFTAPSATQSSKVTITVTSTVDTSKSASASVEIVAPATVAATANPQVALLTIGSPDNSNVSVQFGPTTTYGLTTWTQPAAPATGPVSLFVAGMLANTLYHVRAVIQFSDGTQFMDADQVFTTGALPPNQLPALTVTTTPGMTPQSGVELLDMLTIPPGSTPVGLAVSDLSGNVLWSYNSGLTGVVANPIKLLPNGHFLINFSGSSTDGINSVLQEVDLTGKLTWQMSAADLNTALASATCTGCNITVIGTHHDFQFLPNGHLIVIASLLQVISGVTVTGDAIIDLDQNHNPVWLWNEFDHLDTNRQPYLFPDWTHTNAVIYSADDGNLIISIRHQNWLVKIDYANGAGAGDILWHLGYQGDFGLQGVADPTDPSNWFYAQHGPSFATSNTTGKFSLVLFDNGDDRVFASGVTCGAAGQLPCLFSTVPLLELDETAKTATVAFNPTTSAYSFFGGNAETLKNGNVEYAECAATALPANNAAIYEVTQTSPPQTVWQMQIAGQYAYRGMRIPSLYPGVQW
jgi:arylsulfate sulfotransferase